MITPELRLETGEYSEGTTEVSDEEVMAQMEKWLKTSLLGALGRRLKAIASSRYMAHRLLQTVHRPLKEKGAQPRGTCNTCLLAATFRG